MQHVCKYGKRQWVELNFSFSSPSVKHDATDQTPRDCMNQFGDVCSLTEVYLPNTPPNSVHLMAPPHMGNTWP